MKPRVEALRRAAAVLGICVAALAGFAGSALADYSFQSANVIQPGELPTKQVEGACGLAIGSDGSLYLSDYYHDAVEIFTNLGPYAYQYSRRVVPAVAPSGPCGLAAGGDGALYVNNYHQNVVRFAPGLLGSATTIDSADSTGVAVDPATGNVYVNDRTYVAVYEPSGAPVLVGGEPLRIGLGSLVDGYGVAVASASGLVYVADGAEDVVKVYDPAVSLSAPSTVIDASDGPQNGFVSLHDAALALDQSNGHVLVVDNLQPGFESPEAVVDEFDAAGVYQGQIHQQLVAGEPTGLAVDQGTGDVFVTTGNAEGSNVLAFAPRASAPLSLPASSSSLPVGSGARDAATGVPTSEDRSSAPGPSLRLSPAGASGLTVTVPGPGLLTATGQGLRSLRVHPVSASTPTLRLHLNQAGRRALSRSKLHELRVGVQIAFSATDGTPTVRARQTVTFTQKRGNSE